MFTIWQNRDYFLKGWFGYGKLAFALIHAQISFLGLLFWLCYIAYLATLLMGPVSICTALGYFLLAHATKWCEYLLTVPSRYHVTRLSSILHYRQQTVVPWLKLLPYAGMQFLVFLLLNIPFSCYLFCIILFTRPSAFLLLMCLALVSGQWFVIFGMHVVFASLNNRLTRPNRSLFRIASSRRRSPLSLRATLNLALHLQAFHCCRNRRYGFDYGSLGTISMLSFAKVC